MQVCGFVEIEAGQMEVCRKVIQETGYTLMMSHLRESVHAILPYGFVAKSYSYINSNIIPV